MEQISDRINMLIENMNNGEDYHQFGKNMAKYISISKDDDVLTISIHMPFTERSKDYAVFYLQGTSIHAHMDGKRLMIGCSTVTSEHHVITNFVHFDAKKLEELI